MLTSPNYYAGDTVGFIPAALDAEDQLRAKSAMQVAGITGAKATTDSILDLLASLSPHDTLVVHHLGHLAPSIDVLAEVLRIMEERKIALMVLKGQNVPDSRTPQGIKAIKQVMTMLPLVLEIQRTRPRVARGRKGGRRPKAEATVQREGPGRQISGKTRVSRE